MPTLPNIETPPPDASPDVLRKWAWRMGCRSVFGDDAAIDRLLSRIRELPNESQIEIKETFNEAMRRGRDPLGPEKAAEAVLAFESMYGHVRTRNKLGRSKSYPRLLLMAYALGRDGKAFAFATHRISKCLKVDVKTVLTFKNIMCRENYFRIIRDGTIGNNGQPAWYKLNVDMVREELGLDRMYATFEYRLDSIMA